MLGNSETSIRFLPLLLGVSGFVFIGYTLSRILRRNDVADGMWGLGFVGVALAEAALAPNRLTFRAQVVLGMVLLWGLRLSVYLWIRLLRKTEDSRYANWRSQWNRSEPWRAFIQVFLLQGVFLGLISLPITLIFQAEPTPISGWTFVGLSLYIVGFTLEVVSDAQMAEFKRDKRNQGQPITTGLWKQCRHPNYLGEILIWWGIFLFGADLPWGILGIVSPLVLTFLIVRISGVTLLDQLLKKRGKAFQEYIQKVPALIPFHWRDVFRFGVMMILLLVLDGVWLGQIMRRFYLNEMASIARIRNGSWDIVNWAALHVYFFLSLGLSLFVIRGSASRLETFHRGVLFGWIVYGIYEMTNISLVRGWPIRMALVDIIWGAVLCGTTAFIIGPRKSSAQDLNEIHS